MKIIYLISILMLFISFILKKKTDKKINILSFICISIIALFCYNTFICYILTFFVIPIKLWLLSIINIVISIILSYKVIRKKEIQKYTFDKISILYITIILIIVILISYFNFGSHFNVNYETGDPSVHYLTSVMFAKSNALLPGAESDAVYGNLNFRKTVSYVNSGLLMKCLCPNLETIDCYNIFVSFGIFVLLLTGITIYAAMENIAKKKEHKLWAFALATICMLGYPLNSFLFGFEYLSMGLLVICGIINLMYYYKEKIIEFKCFVILMALLNFGLFSSYYMFVPFVYPSIWIYFCIENYKRHGKIITKELLELLGITLIIPFILGYIYHLEPSMYAIIIDKVNNKMTGSKYANMILDSGFAIDGYIYINIYSNMLLLLPLPIYFIFKDTIKNKLKDNTFLSLLLILTILFIEVLFIGYGMKKVSMYYLMKNYFALWIILAFLNYKALIDIAENSKYISRLLIVAYLVGMIVCTIFSKVEVKYVLSNTRENILSTYEVFGANKTIIFDKPIDFNQEEIKILKYARKNLDYNSKIEIVADEQPNYWAYVLLDYINDEEKTKKYYGQDKLNTKLYLLETNINKVDYMIYFNKSKEYNKLKDKLFENSEIIYENSAGGILKYKK